MAFIPKPNTGTLWPNDRKDNDRQPNVRGDLFLDRQFLKDLMSNSDEELIRIAVSGWTKELAGKKCLTLAASVPYVKPEKTVVKQTEVADDDIPF